MGIIKTAKAGLYTVCAVYQKVHLLTASQTELMLD